MSDDFDFEALEPEPRAPALHKTPRKGRHAILPGAGLPSPDFVAPMAVPPSLDPPLPDLDVPGRLSDQPFHLAPSPANTADTETLLNALIGECHFMMREVAFRCIIQSTDADNRVRFMNSAMNLAETGAKVAETVGRLRGVLPANETRRRMIFEHVHTRTGEGE
jgi:hypothetical protein